MNIRPLLLLIFDNTAKLFVILGVTIAFYY